MVLREDAIRREALARDLGRRQAMASHDDLRVIDYVMIALERLREREGDLDLDENHRDIEDWRRDALLAAAALEALPDARFDIAGAEPGYRAGWNAAIDHVVAALTQAQDARVFEAIAQIKQIDHDRARLYEEAAAEHLERIELARAGERYVTLVGATELDAAAAAAVARSRTTTRILTPVDAFETTDLATSIDLGGEA